MRWAVLALLGAALAGCSTTTIHGYARDAETHEPLGGVNVLVDDDTTFTDLTGRYTLEVDESEDPVAVRVARHGYVTQSFNAPIRGQDLRQDWELLPRRARP